MALSKDILNYKVRKFFHIFLVFSLLFSTVGYAVTKHFCGKVLAHVSIGHETQSCCESAEVPSGCECENQTDHVVMDDDFHLDQQGLIKISPAWQATLVNFIRFLAFTPVLEVHNNKLHPTLDYPPFTDPDIHISVQSFLL